MIYDQAYLRKRAVSLGCRRERNKDLTLNLQERTVKRLPASNSRTVTPPQFSRNMDNLNLGLESGSLIP